MGYGKGRVRKPGKSKKFSNRFEGPYQLVQRLNDTTFMIKGRGKRLGVSQTFHVNRFKKFTPRDEDFEEINPRRRKEDSQIVDRTNEPVITGESEDLPLRY